MVFRYAIYGFSIGFDTLFSFQQQLTGDGKTANLNSILGISALAGLFTEITTAKLKDILQTIFGYKDERPENFKDPDQAASMPASQLKINDASPQKLVPGQSNTITLTGQALDSKKLVIKIDDVEISGPNITKTMITFAYTADMSKTEFNLTVTDDTGKNVFTFQFQV